jgi:hypothetical protein
MDIITTDYMNIFTAIVTIASTFVNWTDSPKDDNLYRKFYKIIKFFAMVNYKAKQK